MRKEDEDIIKATNNKNRIIFVNKSDLNKKLEIKLPVIYGSTLIDNGLDDLKNEIKKLFNMDDIEKRDLNYLSSAN